MARRTLDTTTNTPVLFELQPTNPGSVVHTNWLLAQTGMTLPIPLRKTGHGVNPLG